MAQKDESACIEDQTQIDALEKFVPRIREILTGYRDKRQLSAIARKLVGIFFHHKDAGC